jgi:threonine synthase
MSKATHLECSLCHNRLDAGVVANLCTCGGPLLVRYDLDRIRHRWRRREVANGPSSMWRYAPLLPPANESIVTLGEGWTPLVRTERLGARVGADDLWVKDEGLNPTASFKARGLSCAVSMCVELGIRKVVISSAGNAASALAAYAAAAGIEAYIFMPRDVPQGNYLECMVYGARVTLVDGLIGDCGRMVAERAPAEGWFDVGTLQEPYRIEGEKTMGYEVAEQLDWELPDAILYPTGGGVGLIGMWKAFEEMEKLGWIGGRRPKMIAVQAEDCEPVVRQSGGTAIAVSDNALLEAGLRLAADEGIYAAPEGAACVAALEKLLASGFLKRSDRIVLYNTGSGLKYPAAYSARFPR